MARTAYNADLAGRFPLDKLIDGREVGQLILLRPSRTGRRGHFRVATPIANAISCTYITKLAVLQVSSPLSFASAASLKDHSHADGQAPLRRLGFFAILHSPKAWIEQWRPA